MINKVIKNIKWKMIQKRMKSVGVDNRVGLDFSISGEKYISIGSRFRGGKHIIIDAIDKYNDESTGYTPEIIIGNDVTFTNDCYVSCINKIHIGDGTLLGANTFICDNFHGNGTIEEREIIPSRRPLFSKGPVVIGKNVWIGRNVCIMPNVTIGDNVIIGANSVVTHDVAKNSVVAGIPARVIKSIK